MSAAPEPFKFYCVHCGQRISATPAVAGTRVHCPVCDGAFIAPVIEGLPSAAVESAPGASPGASKQAQITRRQAVWLTVFAMLTAGAFGLMAWKSESKGQSVGVSKPTRTAAARSKPTADTRSKSEAEPEKTPVPPPERPNQILGTSKPAVDLLLYGWPAKVSRRSTSKKQVITYSGEVEIIVTFANQVAVGATVINRTGPDQAGLSESKFRELARLVGQMPLPEQVKRDANGVHEFHVGEI